MPAAHMALAPLLLAVKMGHDHFCGSGITFVGLSWTALQYVTL